MSKLPLSNKSPLLTPLIGLTVGIYLQHKFKLPLWFLITSLSSILISLYFFSKKCTAYLVLALVMFSGALTLKLQSDHKQILLEPLYKKPLNITGTITNKEQDAIENKELIVIKLNHAHNISNNQIIKTSEKIFCYTKFLTDFKIGDVIEVTNIIIPRRPPGPKQPSFDDYLTKENALSAVFIYRPGKIFIKHRPAFSLRRFWWESRHKIHNRLIQNCTPRTQAFLGFLFFGQKKHYYAQELRELFNRWGIAHYLARSGLHIMLLIMLWGFLLSFIPLPLQLKRVILVAVCLVYAFLSWSSVPFLRSLSAFLLVHLGRFFWQQTNTIHLLCIICLLMLYANPIQLFFLDFQLTFILTFALLLLDNLNFQEREQDVL